MGKTTLKKINSEGNYTPFPGVTVVADIQQSDDTLPNLWETIHTKLKTSAVISQYYAVLPWQSFHMTTCNLMTEAEAGDNWTNYLAEKLTTFQKMRNWLKQNAFNPQIKISNLHTSDVLQLQLELPDMQNDTIQAFANAFGEQDNIPFSFHITLAYGYKDILSQEIYEQIVAEFVSIITPIMEQEIQLKAPTLCYFKTMEAFTPWDATANPFVQATTNIFSQTLLFFCSFLGIKREENEVTDVKSISAQQRQLI